MSDYPTLANPPISEAAIEFRFFPNIPFQKIQDFCNSIKEEYPIQQVKNLKQITFSFNEQKNEMGQVPDQKELGPEMILVTTEDQKKIFQFWKDKLIFSRVDKYSTWDEFSSEALKIWTKFQQEQEIKTITRIGARFINNLKLPKETKDFSEYLKIAPTVPSEISSLSAGFLTRVFLKNDTIKASGIVAQALDPNKAKVAETILPVILDIDVFMNVALQPLDTILMELLLKLRSYKNSIFFNSLTSKTLELYK